MSSFDLWHVDAQNRVIGRGTIIVNVALKACSNGGRECCEDEERDHLEREFGAELVPVDRVYKSIEELCLEYGIRNTCTSCQSELVGALFL